MPACFPEAPKELEGVALKVEYISILAQAQKLVGVVGQDRFLQSMSVIAQEFPEVLHKIDIFQVTSTTTPTCSASTRRS
jgi:hypothetical protein